MRPTLKSGKDQQNVESYRPISNLSFLGKSIEMAAKKPLTAHMETLNVLPGDQSVYCESHSTETALCGIVSDVLEYMDDSKCAILILLDLSAAFDTVDYELLISDPRRGCFMGLSMFIFLLFFFRRDFVRPISLEPLLAETPN